MKRSPQPVTDTPNRLQVNEIFRTLQGEGPFVGHPAIFIRMAGCHLQCTWCDTDWDDDNDPFMTPGAIAGEAIRLSRQPVNSVKIAVLTGGEPLRQDLTSLVQHLLKYGMEMIQIETAGTFFQPWMDDPEVHVVVSPKTRKIHAEFMRDNRPRTYFKYVLDGAPAPDGLPSTAMQPDFKGGRPARPPEGVPIYLSPCDHIPVTMPVPEPGSQQISDMEPYLSLIKKNAEQRETTRDTAMDHGYIMSLQTHKLLGIR